MSTSPEQVRPDENGSGEPKIAENDATWIDWIDSFSQVSEYRDCPDTKQRITESEEFVSLQSIYERNKMMEALKKRSLDQLIQDARICIWNCGNRDNPPTNFERNIQSKLFDQELAEALQNGEIDAIRGCFFSNWRWQDITKPAIVEIAEWLLKEGRREQACAAFIQAGENERAEEIVNQMFDEGVIPRAFFPYSSGYEVFNIKGIEKTTKRLLRGAEGVIRGGARGYICCRYLYQFVQDIFASLKDPLETEIEKRLCDVGDNTTGYRLTDAEAAESERCQDIGKEINRFAKDLFASLQKKKSLEAEIEQRLRRIADRCLELSAFPNGCDTQGNLTWDTNWESENTFEEIAKSIFSFLESFDQPNNK